MGAEISIVNHSKQYDWLDKVRARATACRACVLVRVCVRVGLRVRVRARVEPALYLASVCVRTAPRPHAAARAVPVGISRQTQHAA